MSMRAALLVFALAAPHLVAAQTPHCIEASFETASDHRALPAWLRDRCWHRQNALTDLPAPPSPPLALPWNFADSSEPSARLPSAAETRALPVHSFGLDGDRIAPVASQAVAYGDNAAVYQWVARMTGGAHSPQREALDRATRDLHLPLVGGGPAAQMLALGVLVATVSVRRRQLHNRWT